MSEELEQKEQVVAADVVANAVQASSTSSQEILETVAAVEASLSTDAAATSTESISNPTERAAKPVESQPIPAPTPIRSAKEAINAMYAQGGNRRLSNYLATSAKEIINASNRSIGNSKSASNLHRGSISHQIESVQPSAAGSIKSSQTERIIVTDDVSDAMDPLARKTAPATKRRVVKPTTVSPTVVKTSLKLDPRKKTLKTAPRTVRSNSMQSIRRPISTRKGTTSLEQLLMGQDIIAPAAAASTATHATTSAQPTPPARPAVKRPRTRAPQGLVQDIMRPAPRTPSATSASVQTIENAAAQTVSKAKNADSRGPLDSIKRRFKAAPKGFAKTIPEMQAESYTGYDDLETVAAPKPAVEIYGLMDDEPTGKSTDGLGVVEDYKGSAINEQKVAQGSGTGTAPDNNKYSIKGQSPLFLKSVNVEKRPLSEAPAQRKDTVGDGTLYAQPSTEALSNKNIYEPKPATAKKATVPTKPTVIIPASRRSKAPLICLLILTVILGAAVGAFIYLCFFQYME